jgi:hypothetical protein
MIAPLTIAVALRTLGSCCRRTCISLGQIQIAGRCRLDPDSSLRGDHGHGREAAKKHSAWQIAAKPLTFTLFGPLKPWNDRSQSHLQLNARLAA